MHTTRTRPLAYALLLVAAGCNLCGGPDLNPEPPSDEQTEEFCQRPASKVDILWVVDNSGSMTAEQSRLADRFSDFFRQLQKSLVDYHIGVVTTSIQDGLPENANGKLRRYDGPNVTGCSGCRFLTKEVPCSNPDIRRNDGESVSAFESRLQNECPAALVFRRMVTVGNQGSAFETGLQSSALALGALVDSTTGNYQSHNGQPVIPDENQGFIRRREGTCQPVASTTAGLDCSQAEQDNCAEPSLYVIYVSDEQDFSSQPSRYYYRVLEGLKGAGNEGKIVTSVITGWPTGATIPTTKVCEVYNRKLTGARDAEIDALTGYLTMVDKAQPACTDPSGMNTADDSAVVGSRYIDVACRSGGVVADICSSDYSAALNQLGADAAGLARKFTLGNWDNIDFGADNQPFSGDEESIRENLNCDGAEGTSEQLDLVLCVKATNLNDEAEVLVPRDNARGWHLETSTHSVRFDGSFIPKPGTPVKIRYQLKGQGQ